MLSGRRYEHSSLAEVDTICGIPLSQVSDEGVHPEGRHLGFSTLHRFKGLDSDVVIFLDVDSGKHVTPAHRYVAASRAKHRLFVVEGV